MVNDIVPPSEANPQILSKREAEVIRRAREGATDKEIADELGLSVPTLRTYWGRVRQKLGAVNRTHAIVLASVPQTPASSDMRERMVETIARDRLSIWVWQPKSRQVVLDGHGLQLFCLGDCDGPMPMDRLLAHIWAPDRTRFERYLCQCSDLRPMTPIELRTGVPGDYRNLVRTVNLVCQTPPDASVLLATTTIHVFN